MFYHKFPVREVHEVGRVVEFATRGMDNGAGMNDADYRKG